MKIFKDRVAFVTGGASGIGYGMVRNFLKEGMKVVVVDYAPAHCDEIREMHAGDPSVHVIRADVSDRDEVREIYRMLDDLMPKDQVVPPARMAFEDFRREVVREAYELPVKD